jgi:hypothetical protein
MAKIPELSKPTSLRPHWMAAVVSGQSTNARLPLSHLGARPKGAILVSLADYVADAAATADADPGAGKVRWNNAAQASATEIYIDDADSAATDYSALWATLSTGGHLYLYKPDDLDIWQQWSITTVTDAAGYLKLGVSLVASNGSFTDADAVVLTIQQPNPAAGVDRNVVTALASSGGTLPMDAGLGDYFTHTLSENTTLSISNVPAGCTLSLLVVGGASPYTLTLPAGSNWGDGVTAFDFSALAAGEKALLVLTTLDSGSTYDATARKRA